MSASPAGHHGNRSLHLETFEPRIVMSAQPVADFALGPWQDEILSDAPVPLPTPQLLDIHTASGATGVRDLYGFSGTGQTVVVIDTGITYDHIAFGGYGTGQQIVGGWDFAENDANPYDDRFAGGHGTHVAGIIGSRHAVYPGVAPGVDLVALRVFNDNGQGYFDWIEQALNWVYDNRNAFANPITTVNLSIGSTWNSSSIPSWAMLEDEFARLEAEGIFIAVAAGNSFATYNTTGLSYPAASPHVVPVAAVDANGQLASFSQRDARVIAAPGTGIWSAVPDYLGNFNGRADDWAQLSGTSMAAPYVAGASTLVREALAFTGVTDINQDLIYQWMRNSGDQVYDPITGQWYTRLNLGQTIAAIMPADDYGSTWQSAYGLGTIGDRLDLSGVIGTLDDRDYFRFTAGATGKLTLSVEGTHQFLPSWELISAGGAATRFDGDTWTLDVVAGQSYVVGLSSSGGLGYYNVEFALEPTAPAAIDWGTVAFERFDNVTLGGGAQWFTFSAARNGLVSIEALHAATAAGMTLEVYDAAGNMLAAGSQSADGTRAEIAATAGQTFRLRVVGNDTAVDFRLANLVSVADGVVQIHGTAGNDKFSFVGGSTLAIGVNGATYHFAADAVRAVEFHGGGGSDQIVLTGSAGNDFAILRPGEVQLRGEGYQVRAVGVGSIAIHGGGGNDRAFLYDSAGNDSVVARPMSVTLSGPGFSNTVHNFGQIQVYASTGHDVATVYDSQGNDFLVARGNTVQMSGPGYRTYLQGFSVVRTFASGGNDRALIYHVRAGGSAAGTTQLLTHGFDFYSHRFEPGPTSSVAQNLGNASPAGNGGPVGPAQSTESMELAAGGTTEYLTVDSTADEIRAALHDAVLEEVSGQSDPIVPPIVPGRDDLAVGLIGVLRKMAADRDKVDDFFDGIAGRT